MRKQVSKAIHVEKLLLYDSLGIKSTREWTHRVVSCNCSSSHNRVSKMTCVKPKNAPNSAKNPQDSLEYYETLFLDLERVENQFKIKIEKQITLFWHVHKPIIIRICTLSYAIVEGSNHNSCGFWYYRSDRGSDSWSLALGICFLGMQVLQLVFAVLGVYRNKHFLIIHRFISCLLFLLSSLAVPFYFIFDIIPDFINLLTFSLVSGVSRDLFKLISDNDDRSTVFPRLIDCSTDGCCCCTIQEDIFDPVTCGCCTEQSTDESSWLVHSHSELACQLSVDCPSVALLAVNSCNLSWTINTWWVYVMSHRAEQFYFAILSLLSPCFCICHGGKMLLIGQSCSDVAVGLDPCPVQQQHRDTRRHSPSSKKGLTRSESLSRVRTSYSLPS